MKESEEDLRKDLRPLLLKNGFLVLVYLAIFVGLYVFVYFETRFNPILFLVVAIFYAVLAALCLASVLIPMGALVLNLKDILAKRYERYLKRSLF